MSLSLEKFLILKISEIIFYFCLKPSKILWNLYKILQIFLPQFHNNVKSWNPFCFKIFNFDNISNFDFKERILFHNGYQSKLKLSRWNL